MYLHKNLPYDPYKDFTHLAAGIEPVDFATIRTFLPVNSLRELVAYAKRNPAKLSYGSGGTAGYHQQDFDEVLFAGCHMEERD